MLKRVRSEPVKPRQEPKEPRPPTQGEIMLAAKPGEQEEKIKDFAASMDIYLNDNILKSMAKGASVSVEGVTYRARADGALYRVQHSAITTEGIYERAEYLIGLLRQDNKLMHKQLDELKKGSCKRCGDTLPGDKTGCCLQGDTACWQTQGYKKLMLDTL